MKLREAQTLAVIHKETQGERRRKILYAKHLTFKLYLSVCSGGSTEPGKAAAWQQDLGLIIGKADLPLGEVGTALQVLASLSSQHPGRLPRASTSIPLVSVTAGQAAQVLCLCTAGEAGSEKAHMSVTQRYW